MKLEPQEAQVFRLLENGRQCGQVLIRTTWAGKQVEITTFNATGRWRNEQTVTVPLSTIAAILASSDAGGTA